MPEVNRVLNDDQIKQLQNDHLEHVLQGQPESETKPVTRVARPAPAPGLGVGEVPAEGARVSAPAYLSKGQQLRERGLKGEGAMDEAEKEMDAGELKKLDAWNEQAERDNVFGISDMQRVDRMTRERVLSAGKSCPTCHGRGYVGNPAEEAAIAASAAQKEEVISEKVAEVNTLVTVVDPATEGLDLKLNLKTPTHEAPVPIARVNQPIMGGEASKSASPPKKS